MQYVSVKQRRDPSVLSSKPNYEGTTSKFLPFTVTSTFGMGIVSSNPFYKHGLTSVPAWISNNIYDDG